MARARRTCAQKIPDGDGFRNCPLLAEPGQERCRAHLAEREAARGSAAARGYGTEHGTARVMYGRLVRSGQALCWRCGGRIVPGTPWDVGHDGEPPVIMGPEHANQCNRRAAALKGHGKPWTPAT